MLAYDPGVFWGLLSCGLFCGFMAVPIAEPRWRGLRVVLVCRGGSLLLVGGMCAGVGGNLLLITGSSVPVLRRINCVSDIGAAL